MFTPIFFLGKLFSKYLNMFSHPAKIRVQNIIGKRFYSRGISFKNEDGVLFTLDANDWITRSILLEKNYENFSTDLAKKLLSTGGLFIDVGANFGLFTCIVAHNNDNVKVIAVEPNYKVIPRLLNNIQQNGLQNSVRLINIALSKKIQFVSMEQSASNNLGTTVTKPISTGLLSILSCSLDFLFKENNIVKVDLLKIDIEGNEFDILEHFPFEMYNIKNIILEYNRLSNVSFDQLNSFFISKGYKCYTLKGKELFTDEQEIIENNIWFVNQKNHV